MRTVLACFAVVTVLTGSTACGTDTVPPTSSGHWTEHRLEARPGADSPVGFAADGDDILVVVLGEDGTLRSHLSKDGGEFESGERFADGAGYPGFADPVRLDGTWWLVGSGGHVGEGDDETLAFEPRVLRSDDGLTWESVEVSGIPSPVDVNAVAVVDHALVAVGDKRNGVDTGGASFEAALWRSEDGAAWTEVPMPGVVSQPSYRDESVATQVTLADNGLFVGGAIGRQAAMWYSADQGQTWARLDSRQVGALSSVSGLVSAGSTVVVSGTARGRESGSLVLRSDDGGRSFSPTADQPNENGDGYAPLWAGGGRFFTFSEPSVDLYSDPAVCYVDLDLCRFAPTSEVGHVLASEDGEAWWMVETSPLDVGDGLVGVAVTDDGRFVMAHVVPDGIAVHSWTAGAGLPMGLDFGDPERAELVTVPEGEDPEPGVRYHAPLYVHCGMDWLYLGGTPWQRTDGGPDVETGAGDDVPPDSPLAGQMLFGYATLDDRGVVEYSIGEGDATRVIATYERTGRQPPGCD